MLLNHLDVYKRQALERVIASFQTVLYEDDEQFLENMKTKNLEGDDIRRYQHWEWTQGVGLYLSLIHI